MPAECCPFQNIHGASQALRARYRSVYDNLARPAQGFAGIRKVRMFKRGVLEETGGLASGYLGGAGTGGSGLEGVSRKDWIHS